MAHVDGVTWLPPATLSSAETTVASVRDARAAAVVLRVTDGPSTAMQMRVPHASPSPVANVMRARSVRPERHLGAMPHVDMSARSETVRAPFSCDLIRRYAALAPDSISGLVGASARLRPSCLGRAPARGGRARYGRSMCQSAKRPGPALQRS